MGVITTVEGQPLDQTLIFAILLRRLHSRPGRATQIGFVCFGGKHRGALTIEEEEMIRTGKAPPAA